MKLELHYARQYIQKGKENVQSLYSQLVGM